MKAVFGDTAYFLALVNARDHLHAQAAALSKQPPGALVTTEWVLMELGDALALPHARERFVSLVATLRAQPDVTVVPASHDAFIAASELFAARPDKSWSLTDCTSFVVMEKLNMQDALTADQHFEQAGFTRLMHP